MPRAATDKSSRRRRDEDATVPVRTVFLKRGASTTLHRHEEPTAWIRVVTGEMVDERWRRDSLGSLLHERRVLRGEQSLAAPVDSLHRVRALRDTAFVTTCVDGCAGARAASDEELDAATRARPADRSALITAVGAPIPAARRPRSR